MDKYKEAILYLAEWLYRVDDDCGYVVHKNGVTLSNVEKVKSILEEPEEEIPMGVSQWRNHGKKFGYDKYFGEPEEETEYGIFAGTKEALDKITILKEPTLSEKLEAIQEWCNRSEEVSVDGFPTNHYRLRHIQSRIESVYNQIKN